MEPVVRQAAPGDGAGMALAWLDAGRYYASLAPDVFQVPEPDGLAAAFERALAGVSDPPSLVLVAVADGAVVGYVQARAEPPAPDARWELLRALRHARVHVDTLVVAESARRHGAGTALMAAVERWAAAQGAALVALETYGGSPLSVPFYEGLGYGRHNVGFRKRLR